MSWFLVSFLFFLSNVFTICGLIYLFTCFYRCWSCGLSSSSGLAWESWWVTSLTGRLQINTKPSCISKDYIHLLAPVNKPLWNVLPTEITHDGSEFRECVCQLWSAFTRKCTYFFFWRTFKGKIYPKIQLSMLMFHTFVLGRTICFLFFLLLFFVPHKQRMGVFSGLPFCTDMLTVIQWEITRRDIYFWTHSSRKWAWLTFVDRKRYTLSNKKKKKTLECVEHHNLIILNRVKVWKWFFPFKMRPYFRNLSATVHFVSLISFSSCFLAVLHCASGSYRWAASEHLACY